MALPFWAHLLIAPYLLPLLLCLGLCSVYPLEGQRLLHGQHELGSTLDVSLLYNSAWFTAD